MAPERPAPANRPRSCAIRGTTSDDHVPRASPWRGLVSGKGQGAMQAQEFDAIVVGAGISGGWAAKELTEKGLRVLVLERGRNVEHIKDYVNATKGVWEYAHRGGRTKAMEELYPILKRDYPLNEKNLDFWASDKDN